MIGHDSVYSFSAFRYDIVQCDRKKVGNRNLYGDIDFDWNADINNRFSYWNHSRIWCVADGGGLVKTTFGEFELKKGVAYYIPQSTLLETRCDDYMVQYFVDFLPLSDFIPMENMFAFNNFSCEYDLILSLIKKIMTLRDDATAELKKTAIMNMILSCFIKESLISANSDSPMLTVAEKINSCYDKNLTVAALAAEFGYSIDYFSHVFKKTFGISPQKFIINKRIAAAKHLLLTTDNTVAQIALSCGFTDPLYFTRIFSKEMGASPTAFKLSFKNIK